jgi:hypothetical protein
MINGSKDRFNQEKVAMIMLKTDIQELFVRTITIKKLDEQDFRII